MSNAKRWNEDSGHGDELALPDDDRPPQMRRKPKWVLLICALSIPACLSASQSDAAAPGRSEANRVVAEGCLQRSGWEYFLYEKDGMQEQLTSYPKLKDFVGHEIQITGVRGVKTVDTTPPGGASSVVMHPVINVKAVKDLGRHCVGAN